MRGAAPSVCKIDASVAKNVEKAFKDRHPSLGKALAGQAEIYSARARREHALVFVLTALKGVKPFLAEKYRLILKADGIPRETHTLCRGNDGINARKQALSRALGRVKEDLSLTALVSL